MAFEGELDLNALIEQDKKNAKLARNKEIEKKKQIHKEQRRRFEDDLKKRVNDNRNRDQNREKKREHVQSNRSKGQQKGSSHFGIQAYAIKITGLLSEISIQDISKLLGSRKVLSIKSVLRSSDRTPINFDTANQMEVVVVLAEKQEADSFVKEYTDKKLDGKYELSFTFVDPHRELQ